MGRIPWGAALTLILLSSHLTLMMLPNLEAYDIPMAAIVKTLASSFYWIFVFVIYGEIFTSVIGNVFGIERQVKKHFSVPSIIIVGFIFLVCYFISLINYGTLLSYLYPLFGYVSLTFIILLWMKPFDDGSKGKKPEKEKRSFSMDLFRFILFLRLLFHNGFAI